MRFGLKIGCIFKVFDLKQIEFLSNLVLIACFLALEQTENDVH